LPPAFQFRIPKFHNQLSAGISACQHLFSRKLAPSQLFLPLVG
jgi:hypothetical protein